YNLGLVLMGFGRFTDAVRALKTAEELGSKRKDWHLPTARWLQRAKKLQALDAKLLKVWSGEVAPRDAAEQIALAECARYKGLTAAAARLYADAFAAGPKLAEQTNRYNAARAAALAGCGQGKDGEMLDAKQRGRFRRQALDWLQAHLVAWKQRLKSGEPGELMAARQSFQHWQQSPDLAGVRGDALGKLPEPERHEWQ